MADSWSDGNAYEHFIGRWSRQVAPRFVRWLECPPGLRWLDVGCGTGALTAAVLDAPHPTAVLGIDPSAGFVEEARRRVAGRAREFGVGTADDAPPGGRRRRRLRPDAQLRARPRRRRRGDGAAAPAGTVAAYVWDYAGRMQLLRTFWDVACSLDVAAIDLDEAQRFPLCEPPALAESVGAGRAHRRSTSSIEVTTEFADFEDLWTPFLGGTGPAPAYVATLDAPRGTGCARAWQRMVHPDPDGHIRMHARAWAVRGRVA